MNLGETSSLAPSFVSGDSERLRDKAVLQLCQSAKKLEEEGDYEGARAALGDLWQGVSQRPLIDGLEAATQAEVLLRTAAVSTAIGHARQVDGSQEGAKDLVFESLRIFERLGLDDKRLSAQIQLAICYWREGALDEARVTLRELLSRLAEGAIEERLRVLANLAIVERTANRYRDAFQIQTEAAPLFERSKNHWLRGNFHNEFGLVLKHLARSEGRPDFIDRAFIEYTAASYHWERAGNSRYVALVENNLGFLFLESGKLVEAHQHLNRSRALLTKLRDKGSMAQTDETRARVFLAEGRYTQAEAAARSSVRVFEEGDEKSLLAEALTTHGTALARLGRSQRARAQFSRALNIAQRAGWTALEGIAALTMLEEVSASLPLPALRELYQSAESLLATLKDAGIDKRLGQCARAILEAERAQDTDFTRPDSKLLQRESSSDAVLNVTGQASNEAWKGCVLESEVLKYEGQLIKRALETADGSVTRAARMLGITHQGLAFILNGRHNALLKVRTPIRNRRRSILRSS